MQVSIYSLHCGFNNWFLIIVHLWCDGHSTNISACGVWGIKTDVQVFKGEFHTYIHLNYVKVEFLSCI